MIETFHFKLRPVRLKLFYSTVDCFVDSKTLSRLKIFLIILTIQNRQKFEKFTIDLQFSCKNIQYSIKAIDTLASLQQNF